MDAFAVTLRTHVGQALFLHGIDGDVVLAGVFAHDHADVNLVAGLHHQTAAFLHHVQRVGRGFAVVHRDERTVFARGNFAAVRAVLVKQMAHHAHALGGVDEVGFKTNQAAHRNQRLDGNLVADVIHVRDLRLAAGKIFHDRAEVFARNFHKQFFNRLERLTVRAFFPKHLGTRHQDFMAFAAHLLDENRNLHFAASAHCENFRVAGLFDAQCDVRANFFHQAIPDVARGDELAILTGERAIVDGELHLNRRRINRDVRQRGAQLGVAYGFTDEHFLEAGEADDVAGMRLLNLDALHALEVIDRGDLVLRDFTVAVAADGGIADFNFAFVNFSERDTAEVIAVVQVGHEQLKTFAGLRARRRDVLDDGVEERLHRAADVFEFDLGVAFLGGGVDEREIQLLIGGVERHEQFKDLVEHLLGLGVLAVNLVDDDDGLGTGFQRLAEHETRLRLRAFGGIHDEQHAVNHVHDAFDFAAEVRVSGRVHDVDVEIFIFERGVFGADGDALFPFQIHGIHQAFLARLVLVGAEGAGLFQETVHERGLAVVNVRDDRNVSNVLHIKYRCVHKTCNQRQP